MTPQAESRVLVIGGAGFIGSNWASHLLRKTESSLHIIDNLSRPGVRHNLNWLQKTFGATGRLRFTQGDVRDASLMEQAVAEADEVYQFAAQVAVTTSIEDPRLDFEVNLGGTFNVLEAARKAGHRPFVLFTSTNKVYGDLPGRALLATHTRYQFADAKGVSENQPLDFHSPYGCSKGAADQYVRDYSRIFDIPSVVFRMSCIAGPRQFGTEEQGWVAHFLYSALRNQPVTIYGDGRQVRDVLNVDDLVRAFEAARSNRERCRGEIYNVGGGLANTVSLLELVNEVEKLCGRRLAFNFEPRRPGDQLLYVTDFSKLQQHTGWEPKLSFRQTLQHIHDWWMANRYDLEPQAAFAQQQQAVWMPQAGLAS